MSVTRDFSGRAMSRAQRRAARDTVTRAHGRPMVCPTCGNDIYIDAPHLCPPGFVRPARAPSGTFYGYNALNQCCRSWMLLGWPQVDGRPKLEGDERGRMRFDCPRCDGEIWFDIAHPDLEVYWDPAKGAHQPPALVGGRISR